jgi:hypothetical protein
MDANSPFLYSAPTTAIMIRRNVVRMACVDDIVYCP